MAKIQSQSKYLDASTSETISQGIECNKFPTNDYTLNYNLRAQLLQKDW